MKVNKDDKVYEDVFTKTETQKTTLQNIGEIDENEEFWTAHLLSGSGGGLVLDLEFHIIVN